MFAHRKLLRRLHMEVKNDTKLKPSSLRYRKELMTQYISAESLQQTRYVGYLCANFSLPRPLCSRLSPMYATDRRQKCIIA